MENKLNKILYWTPRVLAIIFVLFLGLFSLDVFSEGYGFWQTILALFMHNIPALILLAILIISWKREIIAGVIFILAGLFYIYLISSGGFKWSELSAILTISGPALLTGVLFVISWFKNKK